MMTYNIILSDHAKVDLHDIVAYITMKEGIERAQHVERELLVQIKKLSTFPEGHSQDQYVSADEKIVRFIMKWRWKILFFIEHDTVSVIGIFHVAQDPKKLLTKRF